MVEKKKDEKNGRRVNIGMKDRWREDMKIIGEIIEKLIVKKVRKKVCMDRMEEIKVKKRINKEDIGRIEVIKRMNIKKKEVRKLRVWIKNSIEGMEKDIRDKIGMEKELGDKMNKRLLKDRMVENSGVEKGEKKRVINGRIIRLGKDGMKDGIEMIEKGIKFWRNEKGNINNKVLNSEGKEKVKF